MLNECNAGKATPFFSPLITAALRLSKSVFLLNIGSGGDFFTSSRGAVVTSTTFSAETEL